MSKTSYQAMGQLINDLKKDLWRAFSNSGKLVMKELLLRAVDEGMHSNGSLVPTKLAVRTNQLKTAFINASMENNIKEFGGSDPNGSYVVFEAGVDSPYARMQEFGGKAPLHAKARRAMFWRMKNIDFTYDAERAKRGRKDGHRQYTENRNIVKQAMDSLSQDTSRLSAIFWSSIINNVPDKVYIAE